MVKDNRFCRKKYQNVHFITSTRVARLRSTFSLCVTGSDAHEPRAYQGHSVTATLSVTSQALDAADHLNNELIPI